MPNNYFFMCLDCSHQSLYWNECPASCPICGATGSSVCCVSNESLRSALTGSLTERFLQTEGQISALVRREEKLEDAIAKIDESLYRGGNGGRMDDSLLLVENSLARMEKRLEGLEGEIENIVYNTIRKGISRSFGQWASAHMMEISMSSLVTIITFLIMLFS